MMTAEYEDVKELLSDISGKKIKDIVNYNVIDSWDTIATARKVVRDRGLAFDILFDTGQGLAPWAKKCCHYINGGKTGDCDAALRSMVIYLLAGLEKDWKLEQDGAGSYQLCSEKRKWKMRGDTMNSYAVPVLGLLRGYVIGAESAEKAFDGAFYNGGYFIPKYQQFSQGTGDKIVWSAYILDNYDLFIETFEEVLDGLGISKEAVYEYIRVNDTLGNFIPVPFLGTDAGEFNRPRGTGFSKDFWDLALVCIYNHYMQKTGSVKSGNGENMVREELYSLRWLLKRENNVRLCEEWLESFLRWDDFVAQNFLQDFVYQNSDGTFGRPKEFWKGHFDGAVFPKKPEDYQQFFANASAWTASRGMRLARAVKDCLDSRDIVRLAKKLC